MVDCIKVFNEIEKDFGKELALLTTIAYTIHCSTKPKKKELTGEKSYSERLNNEIKNALFEHYDKLDEVLKIESVIYDFLTRETLEGIGGCVRKSIKELYNEKYQ